MFHQGPSRISQGKTFSLKKSADCGKADVYGCAESNILNGSFSGGAANAVLNRFPILPFKPDL